MKLFIVKLFIYVMASWIIKKYQIHQIFTSFLDWRCSIVSGQIRCNFIEYDSKKMWKILPHTYILLILLSHIGNEENLLANSIIRRFLSVFLFVVSTLSLHWIITKWEENFIDFFCINYYILLPRTFASLTGWNMTWINVILVT